MRRARWPFIVGALIAVAGVAAGVGIARDATNHAHARAVHEQQLARDNASRAVREAQLARDAAVEARAEVESSDQQLSWQQQCFTMYPVPASLNAPGWSHASESRKNCVVAAGKGITPAEYRKAHGP